MGVEQLEDRLLLSASGLVQTDTADFIAAKTGRWSNGSTWVGGVAPSLAASDGTVDVYIPPGMRVTIANRLAVNVDTVNIAGKLQFAPRRNTRLRVDTLYVGDNAEFRVGSLMNRQRANRTAEIVFRGEAVDDPSRIGKGLFAEDEARVYLFGSDKTSFVESPSDSSDPRLLSFAPGSTFLDVVGVPAGWRVGDEIIVTAARHSNNDLQTENFRIRSIQPLSGGDTRIQLGAETDRTQVASLVHDHRSGSGQAVHVANLTRNIVFRSESADVPIDQRGHIMVRTYQSTFENVELRDLGRTDKKIFTEDGVDANGDGRVNQRGRYALHFHRNLDALGASATNKAVVRGSVANSGPGWGFVSHSSNVDFINNVAYGFDGAGFASEAGDEIGSWDGNLAAHGTGDGTFAVRRFEDKGTNRIPGVSKPFRNTNGDLGFTGDGFWLQSPGVEVTNNIASGFDGRGFSVWSQGLFEPDLGEEAGFRTEYIDWDGRYRVWNDGGNHQGRALTQDLSLKKFEGNTAYASYLGVQLRFHNHPNRTFATITQPQTLLRTVYAEPLYNVTTLQDTTIWETTEAGVGMSYVINANLNNTRLFHTDGGTAINAEHALSGTTRFNTLQVIGFRHAIDFRNTDPA